MKNYNSRTETIQRGAAENKLCENLAGLRFYLNCTEITHGTRAMLIRLSIEYNKLNELYSEDTDNQCNIELSHPYAMTDEIAFELDIPRNSITEVVLKYIHADLCPADADDIDDDLLYTDRIKDFEKRDTICKKRGGIIRYYVKHTSGNVSHYKKITVLNVIGANQAAHILNKSYIKVEKVNEIQQKAQQAMSFVTPSLIEQHTTQHADTGRLVAQVNTQTSEITQHVLQSANVAQENSMEKQRVLTQTPSNESIQRMTEVAQSTQNKQFQFVPYQSTVDLLSNQTPEKNQRQMNVDVDVTTSKENIQGLVPVQVTPNSKVLVQPGNDEQTKQNIANTQASTLYDLVNTQQRIPDILKSQQQDRTSLRKQDQQSERTMQDNQQTDIIPKTASIRMQGSLRNQNSLREGSLRKQNSLRKQEQSEPVLQENQQKTKITQQTESIRKQASLRNQGSLRNTSISRPPQSSIYSETSASPGVTGGKYNFTDTNIITSDSITLTTEK